MNRIIECLFVIPVSWMLAAAVIAVDRIASFGIAESPESDPLGIPVPG